ncbi:energy transducer TonB [Daejeonella lutea]|uniref:TonB family C-terminal domain-containing protein n=1 Tax=Daejeonella lutea TaxID=572036 RepID=A0A1T5BKN8_9SPHI|nr:energy transducer TonB [Daejeonella lutea]SKB47796.1 TonB family C-terminal domain-containing protein [Daejeonella lutea]
MKFILLTLLTCALVSFKPPLIHNRALRLPSTLSFQRSTYLSERDTLYLNSEYKEVGKRKQAQYLKLVTKTDSGYVEEIFSKTSQPEQKITYMDAELKVKHGYAVTYLGKNVDSHGRYENDKHEGPWKYYLDDKVSAAVVYKEGDIVNAEYFKTNGETETDRSKIDRQPSFPGGDKGFGAYLVRTLKYPPEARERGVQGTVIVAFTITAIGEIKDITILKSVSQDIDNEAIRVVKGMPLWIPALQFGRPAKARHKMPLNFRLG